ncbi:hypothetical protein [Neobacillus sp. LXY-4]|uniref:hypothetical protein n=1 Tax=Neobacillus sp. LXY-4 TaxID=3379826 RepID=UPI003EE19A65
MNVEKVREVLRARLALHDENDYEIDRCRNDLIELLSKDVGYTIGFLTTCSKEELLTVSEVFEEIAYNLQSQQYIQCLEGLDKKYPELNLTSSVTVAKSFMG